ncbi:LacI family DNA-binding transcriptional regulator [Catenuloplanes atrovinosus]|uniref:Integrase n=1 Tax=Catenuloplanes atrovinosus TaxID=137266 RepID=A0AAE4C7L5_9ACTN|nr:LacI family DNA-binding transcriptional regulator [Catenuloplanes atrovinosus]MDR7273612.1 integrase [Catenuloplanes atrovinosus]
MGYAEKRGDYWRGRYKVGPGKYDTVKHPDGSAVRFRTRREAETAANDAEAALRAGRRRAGASGRIPFIDWSNDWYDSQDLADSTMQNYRRRLEEHLLPTFGEMLLVDITAADVARWEKAERAAGYAAASIRSWRALLHLLLADALDEGRIAVNPAARRKGRGRRTGRSRGPGSARAITSALGVLLIAERAALLSGRDAEFVRVVTLGFTGLRWGESVGLEPEYVTREGIDVQWQLYELDDGSFTRVRPKNESTRLVYAPEWLLLLLREHLADTAPRACSCHGRRYVFSGHRPTNNAARQTGPTLAEVARLAGVSVGTVSGVLNGRTSVAEQTRDRVKRVIDELGYVRGAVTGELAPHSRRNGFATWVFRPAASGRYPAKAPRPARPVPLLAEPWPGAPVHGRNAAERAELCWLPIAEDLTPHGLRHTYKTLMDELGIPPVLKDHQMGHLDGSVQALYSHVTEGMIARLLDGLTDLWNQALRERRRIHPHSPVRALDRLLAEVPDADV